MKQGQSYEQLLTQVEREAKQRHDFYAPANDLHLETDALGSRLSTPTGRLNVRNSAHSHLAEFTGIDRRYYGKLRQQAHQLLDQNVNHWLQKAGSKPRVIRALADDARAIVSPRYALLDNDALLRAIEPVASEIGANIESCDINEDRMILKLVSPKLTGAVKVGDHVQAGIVVRNSETRCSAVEVDWFIYRLVCTNGMVVSGPRGTGTRRRHIGKVWGDSSAFGVIPESVERVQWEEAVWQNLQSNVREAVNARSFQNILEQLHATTRLQTSLEPEQIIERLHTLGPEFKLSLELQERVVEHIHADGFDGSLWHVLNGVTRAAQDLEKYDTATALEELGGKLAALTRGQWEHLVSVN